MISDIINRHDITAIYETWDTTGEIVNKLGGKCSCETQKAVRLARYGRPSGGVAVYIKEQLHSGISRVCCDFEFGILLCFERAFFNLSMDILCFFLYIPPEGSNRYTGELNGIEILRQKILEVSVDFPNHQLIITGDLNARTGNELDYILNDDISYIPNTDAYVESSFNIKRKSKDKTVNNFGKTLLDTCKEFGIHIVNGRKGKDLEGDFTFMSSRGESVIDYVVTTPDIFDLIDDFEIMQEDLSNHFPLLILLNCGKYSRSQNEHDNVKTTNFVRYRWSEDGVERFVQLMGDDTSSMNYVQYENLVNDCRINEAVELLISVIHRASVNMKQNCKGSSKAKGAQPVWWDKDCYDKKREKNRCLNRYRLSGLLEDLQTYKNVKKQFRSLCKQKKHFHKNIVREKIEESVNVNGKFWKILKQMSGKNIDVRQAVSPRVWFSYFKELLNRQPILSLERQEEVNTFLSAHDVTCNDCETNNCEFLNDAITNDDILKAIESMSSGKAAGCDFILVEMLKASAHIVIPYLNILFNKVLDTGVFPDMWTKSVLCPLHKKGSRSDPGNYRGISLLSVLGKAFTKILNARLVKWAELHDLQYEEQAGYRKGYSTIDNIFTLYAITEKYLCKDKGRFYVLFIDFSKAFDSIPHSLLWFKLIQEGVHGKMLKLLRNMYGNLKSCVRTDQGLTEFFDCTVGTRQGCMLSPFLFAFYIGEFIKVLKGEDCKGVYVNENVPNLMALLYADDIANGSDSVGRLQKMINVLENYCKLWGLTLNLLKTKIIVFRRGGIVKCNEKWHYDGKEIEVVSSYKYLGVFFTTKLKWSLTLRTLSAQASKALGLLYQYHYKCGGLPLHVAVKLFETMIIPIMLYSSEVWGYECSQCIESIQVKFFKRILGVGMYTSDDAVMGEVGRYPVALYGYKRCIKYWFKLLKMNEQRLPKACYNMLKLYDENGKITWISKVRCLLEKFGFNYMWASQGVGDEDLFMEIFDTKLKDYFKGKWTENIRNKSKLAIYSIIKTEFEPERYLYCVDIRKYRVALAKLRCSCHKLLVESGRHKNLLMAQRVCKYCEDHERSILEDEYHMIMTCPLYANLRNEYLNWIEEKTFDIFVKILLETNENRLKALAVFTYKSFIVREQYLQSTND